VNGSFFALINMYFFQNKTEVRYQVIVSALFGIDITSECHEAAPCDVAAQLHSVKTGSEVQADMDVNTCHMKSEDTDLFRQHFGSLSTTHKVSDLACNITM
jgi:hypothetical protein